ncbi:MAG: hypothetical protein ACRCVN_04625 [Spirochaetia bacterium]
MQQGQRLQLRQEMRLSTYMRQSLKFLSLSGAEILEEIAQFIDENPAIEIQDEFFQAVDHFSKSLPGNNALVEGLSEHAPSLQDMLHHACQIENFSPYQQEIAYKIISSLDEHGFLSTSVSMILQKEFLPNDYRFVLQKIQSMEPVGCATADSYESLCVQMRINKFAIQPLPNVLKKVFLAWSKNKKSVCQKLLNIDNPQDLESFIEQIKTLSPFPASGYQTKTIAKIFPEYAIFYTNDGCLEVKALYEVRPFIRLSPKYAKDPCFKKYLDSAQAFLQMIEYRENTILRTIRTIVLYQKKLFENGWIALRPLTQKQVATMLNVHEATISRAIQNRYIQSPLGVIHAKDLFSSRIFQKGKAVSKKTLQILIAQMIQTSALPLSDEKIAQKLQAQGYQIARRTVTKYKNQLEKF